MLGRVVAGTELQIPPLRCAPVGMTRVGLLLFFTVATGIRSVADLNLAIRSAFLSESNNSTLVIPTGA
jgi:hypothetical protein